VTTAAAPPWAIAPYNPKEVPWQYEFIMDRFRVALATGSAGGGKSRAAGEKLHAYCLHYPGAMALALRKTRQSMVNSTVLFLERTIIGKDPRVKHRESKYRFEYSNGSVLAYGGMRDDDQREQIRSIGIEGGVDLIWLEEATHFDERDFEELLPRLRGTKGSFRQIMLTTNPAGPLHWIRRRLILGGQASVHRSGAVDNKFTASEYLETLGMLTGVQKARLVDGEWVQAEGVVYAEFAEDNIVRDREPDPARPIELAFDDGYVDPRAILFIQRTGAEIFVFDEIYESRKLGEQHVAAIIERCEQKGWPKPELAIGSPEAVELHQQFRLKGDIAVRTLPHLVIEGIKVVRRLIVDGNGYRAIRVHERCKNLIGELSGSYIYPEEGTRRDDEKPLDGNDHAADALRYWCYARARRGT
jgi:PBSX family phage terminase large subunit